MAARANTLPAPQPAYKITRHSHAPNITHQIDWKGGTEARSPGKRAALVGMGDRATQVAIEEKRARLKQSLRSFGRKGVLGYGAHKGVSSASEAVFRFSIRPHRITLRVNGTNPVWGRSMQGYKSRLTLRWQGNHKRDSLGGPGTWSRLLM